MNRGSQCGESSMKMDEWRNVGEGRGERKRERKRSGERKRPVGTGIRPDLLVSGEARGC